MAAKRIVIVGGVAGGAACAARLRRLDEQAEIFIFERGGDVSFANCGLPYYLGGVIARPQATAGRLARAVPRLAQHRGPHAQRGRSDRPRRAGPSRCGTCRRGETHRALRRPGAVARRGAAPPARARHRPARRLHPAEPRRRRPHPRLDRDAAARRGRWSSAADTSAWKWSRTSCRRGIESHRAGAARPGHAADGPGNGRPVARRNSASRASTCSWRNERGRPSSRAGDDAAHRWSTAERRAVRGRAS